MSSQNSPYLFPGLPDRPVKPRNIAREMAKSTQFLTSWPLKRASKYQRRIFNNPKSRKYLRDSTRQNARKKLRLARALRRTLIAEEELNNRRIEEAEEYLGVLRSHHGVIMLQVDCADEEIGRVKHSLDTDGIPEISLSDEEDNEESSSDYLHPPSSDLVCENINTPSINADSADTSPESEQDSEPHTTPESSFDHRDHAGLTHALRPKAPRNNGVQSWITCVQT